MLNCKYISEPGLYPATVSIVSLPGKSPELI